MGVRGLTTYLRENRAALGHTIELFQPDAKHATHERTVVVVDGWSFIYELMHCANLPWVYGGEYDAFSGMVVRVVSSLIEVGLQLHFVFDGPYPSLKFPTLISRITQTNINGSLLFYRTSASSRSTPRFLKEISMLPPLAYSVCVQTLLDLASPSSPGSQTFEGLLEVHFADEEGDPYAVALAGRLHAYVAGRDSDFLVLNTEGYKGYIPLDELVWHTLSLNSTTSETSSVYSPVLQDAEMDLDESGFKIVHKPKTRKRSAANQRIGRGIIPPDYSTDTEVELSLAFTVYSPEALAAYLELPASLLPLLGALVGNDYTGTPDDPITAQQNGPRKSNLQSLFFERQATLTQRITRVATILRSILSTAFQSTASNPLRRRQKKQIGSVMELIDAAVSALLRSPESMGAGEKEAVVDRIVEATLQYAIPRHDEPKTDGTGAGQSPKIAWASEVCVLHDRATCPLLALLSCSQNCREPSLLSSDAVDFEERGQTPTGEAAHAQVCMLYIAAYRRGALDPDTLDAVNTGTSWPRMFLEDPDKESVSRSIGRPIRELCYALLGAGTESPELAGTKTTDSDSDSDDELVDVREEDEDLLAPLRGALEQLEEPPEDAQNDSTEGDHTQPQSSSALQSSSVQQRPKYVLEYIRRGTHLSAEEIMVPLLSDVAVELSISLPTVSQDPTSPILVQLWTEDDRMTFFLRALRSDVPDVRALSGTAYLSAVLALRWVIIRMHIRAGEIPNNKERQKERWTKEEASAFLGAFEWSESLPHQANIDQEDLSPFIPIEERNVQLVTQLITALNSIEQLAQLALVADRAPSPVHRFSGRRFHAILTGNTHAATSNVPHNVWNACIADLEDAFTQKAVKSKKERKKANKLAATSKAGQPSEGQKQTGGMYDLLAQMDV